jgi:hypothetical protein
VSYTTVHLSDCDIKILTLAPGRADEEVDREAPRRPQEVALCLRNGLTPFFFILQDPIPWSQSNGL